MVVAMAQEHHHHHQFGSITATARATRQTNPRQMPGTGSNYFFDTLTLTAASPAIVALAPTFSIMENEVDLSNVTPVMTNTMAS